MSNTMLKCPKCGGQFAYSDNQNEHKDPSLAEKIKMIRVLREEFSKGLPGKNSVDIIREWRDKRWNSSVRDAS